MEAGEKSPGIISQSSQSSFLTVTVSLSFYEQKQEGREKKNSPHSSSSFSPNHQNPPLILISSSYINKPHTTIISLSLYLLSFNTLSSIINPKQDKTKPTHNHPISPHKNIFFTLSLIERKFFEEEEEEDKDKGMSGSSWVSSHFLLFLFLFTIITPRFAHGILVEKNETTTIMVPLIENEPKMMMDLGMGMMMNVSETRRKLGRFKICALCTCCGGPKGICLPSPCCYAINCNIPNRPFGFCSFTPKTCNCFGCHL